MSNVLFVTWDGGGNLPPALGIAAALAGRGHAVRFLGHERQRAAVEAAGLPLQSYRHARPWSAVAPAGGLRGAADIFLMFTDAGPRADLRAALEHEPANLLVVDAMSLGALQEALATGIPTAALMHSYYHFFVTRWARGPIGALGALRGRAPGRLWRHCSQVLVPTDRELDPAADPLPINVRHVGVVQPQVVPASVPDRPRILVSLSTIYYAGQLAVLQAVLDALARVDADVVVTTGDSIDPAALRAAPHVVVRRFVPHDEVMRSASMLVGHGGHSTTMRALAHDLPVLVLPLHPMLDHAMIGQSVADRGAGLVVRRSASPGQFTEAVLTIVNEPRYRAAAAHIGARLRANPGQTAAADLLESLLR